MRVGMICFSHHGGSGVLATELGKLLVGRGHEVHFISDQRPFRLSGQEDNISFHPVLSADYPAFSFPPAEAALANTIFRVSKDQKLDLLHAHYAIPHAYAACAAVQMLAARIPVVATLHGTDVTVVGRTQLTDITAFVLRKCDAVTAVSDSLAHEAEQIFGKGINVKRIYNFVDMDRFRESPLPNRVANPILLHISNFRAVKRVRDVLESFLLVYRQFPCRLMLVGDGPDIPMAQDFVKQHRIESAVEFLGRRQDIPSIMRSASILLLPSQEESFGLTALEAMACGVPVIASTAGGIPEVVSNAETGYLCPVGDVAEMVKRIMQLLTNDELHAQFSEKSIERAKAVFDASEILTQYEDVYRSAIARVANDQEALSQFNPQFGLVS